MSPESRQKLSCGAMSVVLTFGGMLAGAGATWGVTINRINNIEQQATHTQQQVEAMQSMAMSVVRIEQSLVDIIRRLERMENGR